MAESAEPRALTAALAAPTFVTRTGGVAVHAATRHVERWAPEAGASGVRPLRNLGFVDRLVSPWLDAAQRSASLRLFNQYLVGGLGERAGGRVSWVFPRPWYQDELDWMAAAREAGEQTAFERQAAPTMMTTRGTFVAHATARSAAALPAALYEFVAPSLSVARPDGATTVAAGADAYSPLVPFAAAKAAQVMARMVAPLAPVSAARTSPALRTVLATMLERSASASGGAPATRIAAFAPELVTPPAPRAPVTADGDAGDAGPRGAEQQVIREAIARRAQIAELQRVAQQVAERELTARRAAQPALAPAVDAARPAAPAERAAAALPTVERDERARIEARIAERLAEREREQSETAQRASAEARREQREQIDRAREAAERELRAAGTARLHEQAREAAARDARIAPVSATAAAPPAAHVEAEAHPGARELAAAIAALPRELQATIVSTVGQRPDRAVHAIRELDEALRAVELLAHASAAGTAFESARGPRLMMPAGLGGLVASLETGRESGIERWMTRGDAPAAAARSELRGRAVFAARWLAPEQRAHTALSAAAAHAPAALHHVAWADRWLARFAGASPRALDTLDVASATPELRLAALAAAAPGAVLVAPMFDEPSRATDASPVAAEAVATAAPAAAAPAALRIDDNAETPDDLLVAISAAAARKRAVTRAARTAPADVPAAEVAAVPAAPRETFADLVAQSAPAAPGAGFAAQLASSPFAAALRHVLPLATASTFDVRALLGGGLAASYLAGLVEATRELRVEAAALPALGRDPAWLATYVAPVGDAELAPSRDGSVPELVAGAAPELVSVRTALLALERAASEPAESRPAAVRSSRALVDALAQPLLADSAEAPQQAVAATAPGMVADRAHAWSVAQERSTADLAFDFVTPELVLAARVYGLGAAEAAQAMRLALVGPGQLAAMASAVDRTFVQMMQVEAERRAAGRGDATPALEPSARAASGGGEPRAIETAYPTAAGVQAFGAAPAMFGIDRRAPRGAFLWPSATVGALGLTAPTPDGELQMPVAALELIAAHGVAELGTSAGELSATAPTAPVSPAARQAAGEADVVASAAALVPAARRAKFEALYLALARSANERNASPAARAARAVALAGRGDDTISARERAAIAWDVLPAVYAAPSAADDSFADPVTGQPLSTGALAQRAHQRRAELREVLAGESRPGLASLSARAGEAIGAYVVPAAPPAAAAASSASSSSSSARELGAMLRAPTAAPELVQTGSARPSARAGGGEVEIPPWFEAAARRMFEQRSGSEGMSATELTLVTSAPSAQIAASSRAPSSAVSPAPAPGASTMQQGGQQIDIEKTANEVFAQVLVLIEAARARNGEPYL